MVEERLASLSLEEAAPTAWLRGFKIMSKWLVLDILMFASTEKF